MVIIKEARNTSKICLANTGMTSYNKDTILDRIEAMRHERGIAAWDSGEPLLGKITPVRLLSQMLLIQNFLGVRVEVSMGRGKPSVIIDKDESLEKFDASKLGKLRPCFKENAGTVTAGNSSSISDGGAALVLVSWEKALELRLQVIAKIRGYADATQAPELFTTAPALAIPKAISNASIEASQIDYYEINEAFSVSCASPAFSSLSEVILFSRISNLKL